MPKKKRPLRRGRRILNISDLEAVARAKQALILPGDYQGRQGYSPASWVINFSGVVLLRLLREGIYVYQPKHKRKQKK